jgi:hypothetical protein
MVKKYNKTRFKLNKYRYTNKKSHKIPFKYIKICDAVGAIPVAKVFHIWLKIQSEIKTKSFGSMAILSNPLK